MNNEDMYMYQWLTKLAESVMDAVQEIENEYHVDQATAIKIVELGINLEKTTDTKISFK